MEMAQFDTITRRLRTGTSRRKLAVGALGGVAALVAGTAVAKPGQKGRGTLKSKPTKTPICHFDEETGLYTFVQVPLKAGKGHAKHTNDVLTGVTSAADCELINDTLLAPDAESGLA